MTAKLTIEPRPDLGANVKSFVVDCPHGTTSAVLFPGQAVVGDAMVVTSILDRHHAVEGCRCTRLLRRRYGLPR